MIFARKMPEYCIIIAQKIFFLRILAPSPMPMPTHTYTCRHIELLLYYIYVTFTAFVFAEHNNSFKSIIFKPHINLLLKITSHKNI